MLLELRKKILGKFGSLGAFSKLIGIEQSRLSEILHRKRKLNAKEQQRWAQILGHSRKELFEDKTILTSHK